MPLNPYWLAHSLTRVVRYRLWVKYWDIFTSLLHKSFLNRLKFIVSLPGGNRVLIRLFADKGIIFEIFEKKVYELYSVPNLRNVVVDAGAHIGLFTI